MGLQKKEEERIERIIRGLLKLPENRRCINCNILGPQYVCTTFSTFVCTNCSGIHREFTHRVKSVSMAKFTPEEVTALQAGGNERAKQIYFKEWDPLRHSYPDSCGNLHRLRDFIKNVYVDRKYTGERGSASLPRIRLNDKEESYGNKKSSSLRLEIKSPHSCPGARSDDISFRYLYDESKSPKYAQKYSRRGGPSRSPIKFEVVDDRFRDDEYRNRRLSNSKLRTLSIDGQKNVDRSQPTVARPSGEMMGENAPPPQVTRSGGEGSVEKNPSEKTINKPESCIDLSTKSHQVSDATDGVGSETPRLSQPSESNWATFEASTKDDVPKTPNTNTMKSSTKEATPKATFANPLDLLLSELSGPLVPTTGGMSQVPSGNTDPKTTTVENASAWDFPPTSMGQTTASPKSTDVWSLTSTTATEPAQPSNADPPQAQIHDAKDSNEASYEQNPSSMQYLPSVSVGFTSTAQPTNSPVKAVASNNQPSVAPNTNDFSRAFTELPSQITSKPTQDTRPDVGSQPSTVETKPSGRRELPEDLFTASYSSGPAPLAGWQNVQPHGMGYGMQYYPNAVPPSALPRSPKSTNPFEVTPGRSLIHSSSFPTMASLQGVLPAVAPRTGLMHASSHGSFETMMHQSPSHASPVPPRSPFASRVPTGVSFDHVNEEQPTRQQRVDSFNGDITGFGKLDPIQQSYGGYGNPRTPNSFSNSRGNPFE